MKKFLSLLVLCTSFVLTSKSAVFTSVASGNYNAASTWTFTGSDSNGIPDNDDDVTVAGAHTITLTSSSNARTLIIDVGGILNLNSLTMLVWGDFTNNGSTTGFGAWQFRAVGTFSGNNLNNNGHIYFYANYVIAPGVSITKTGQLIVSYNCEVTNHGNVNLIANGVLNIYPGGKWINAANSTLGVSANVINNGIIDASAVPNIFRYQTNGYNTIMTTNATYYNLALNTATTGTKVLVGDLIVLNNITTNSGVTLDWANNNIAIGGSWRNFGNLTSLNMGTITFNGAGTQTIQRTTGPTEEFNNVTIAGSGTVQLQTNLRVIGTTTLSSGTLDPDAFIYFQRGALWLGDGGLVNVAAAGRVSFIGTVNKTLGGSTGTTFGDVEINSTPFTVTCTTDQIVMGTTTLTSGSLSPGTVTYHHRGASWLANGGSITTAATGAIAFDGSVPQTIGGTVGATFGNIEINSSSTVTLARDLTAVGNFSLLGGTFDVSASSFAVNLSRNFIHNGGTFTAQTGTVVFQGSVAQVVSGSTTTTFNNITSNNSLGGVSVTGIIIINEILQVNSRSFGTSGFGSIILTATGATTYAKIGPLGPGASLAGTNWSIGAFINGPATAYWQYLGSPVNGATLADWDNDARFYMSGVGGNDGNACCPTFFSVRTYNTVANTYTNITSVNHTMSPGRGYMVWMSDNMSQLVAPLPYDTRGIPNFGTVLRSITAGGAGAGYNLVSNPYACPINFPAVVTNSGTIQNNFLILIENGSYVTNPNGGNIAPNQGFMVIATATGNIKFDEIVKNTAANPDILRTANPENYLRITSSNGINGLGGEAVVQINTDAHNGSDIQFDMPFLPSPYEDATNIWSTDKDGQDLLLNALDGNQDKLDIPLNVKSGTPGQQLLAFKGLNGFSAYSCAWLEDLATGEKINLKDHDTYSYQAEEAGETHGFNLHFERDGNCPLNEQMLTPSLDASSQVFVNNGNILVKFGFEELSDVVITVYNVAGQEVLAPKNMTVINETIALDSPGAHGIYMVRIAKGDEIVTKKIYY